MAGFGAELLVFVGAWESQWSWWAVPAIAGAFITALYVLRAVRAIFWGEGPSDDFPDLRDAEGTEWVALVVLGGCIILFGVAPDLILQYIDSGTSDWLPAVIGGER